MRRIFLCDDATEYRALVRAVLSREPDLQIVGEACDGRECLDKVPQTQPDVVLLDIKMPGMSGLEVLPRLRKLWPNGDVVILSTADSHEIRQQAQQLGATAFVRKPLSALDLPGAIRAHLPPLDRRLKPRPT